MRKSTDEYYRMLLTAEVDPNLEVLINNEFYTRTGLNKSALTRAVNTWIQEGKAEWTDLNRLRLIVEDDDDYSSTQTFQRTHPEEDKTNSTKEKSHNHGALDELTSICSDALERRYGVRISSAQRKALAGVLSDNSISVVLAVSGLKAPNEVVDSLIEALSANT